MIVSARVVVTAIVVAIAVLLVGQLAPVERPVACNAAKSLEQQDPACAELLGVGP